MPSKGTPVRTFRCQDSLWSEMLTAIAGRNLISREAAWTPSDFIGLAIREKLKKMQRSRGDRLTSAEDRLPDEHAGK